jgi:hypothetical protein
MAEINVYQQYFSASCTFNGVPRHAASVLLISTSEEGRIRYEVAVSFFPHNDAEDFAVSYDAYFSKVLYDAPGRRSKKREAQLLETLQDEADALATAADATIFWDRPLGTARRG